jgi:hypothetical protein
VYTKFDRTSLIKPRPKIDKNVFVSLYLLALEGIEEVGRYKIFSFLLSNCACKNVIK